MTGAAERALAEHGIALSAEEADAGAAAAAAIATAIRGDATALRFGAEPPDFDAALTQLAGRGDGHGGR